MVCESLDEENGGEEEGEELRQMLLSKSRAPLVGVSTDPGVGIGDLARTIGR